MTLSRLKATEGLFFFFFSIHEFSFTPLMKLLFSLLCLLFMTFTVWGESLPSQEKIDAFVAKLSACCEAGDVRGIKALSCFDGAGAGLIDQSIGFWELLFDYAKKGRSFKDARYIPLAARLADPNANPSAIKWAIDPKIRNGHAYALNLPMVGFVTVSFSMAGNGTASNIWPIGMDSNGDMKFPEWKRTDAPAVLSSPRSSVTVVVENAVSAPSQKQVDTFTDALFLALQSGDLETCKALFCFDGVPEELVDKEVDQWKVIILDDAKKQQATFAKPMFTPLEEYLAKLGEGRKEAEADLGPKIMNGTTYCCNLPIVGMVAISAKTKMGSSGTVRPVGIDAKGMLRFVAQGPK